MSEREQVGLFSMSEKGTFDEGGLGKTVEICHENVNAWQQILGLRGYLFTCTGWVHKTEPCKQAKTQRTQMWHQWG